jgi:hypothetical protein
MGTAYRLSNLPNFVRREKHPKPGFLWCFLRGSREHKKNVLENHEKAIEKGAQPIGCLTCPTLFEGRSIRNRGFCGVFGKVLENIRKMF